jgi:hypothetical protein
LILILSVDHPGPLFYYSLLQNNKEGISKEEKYTDTEDELRLDADIRLLTIWWFLEDSARGINNLLVGLPYFWLLLNVSCNSRPQIPVCLMDEDCWCYWW